MKVGGIVLCGGKSSRMGRAKAWLPFGDEFLLQRVVRAVREVADVVVVVTAPGQRVPPLTGEYALACDEVEDRGPLGGLAAGLAILDGVCDAVYLSACDAPFLTPTFVRRVVACLEEPLPPFREAGAEGRGSPPGAAVPRVGDRVHPLAAAYRVGVLPVVREMLAANRLRATDLFALVPTRYISAEELGGADAELRALCNLNTPDEYAAALRAPTTPGPEGA